VTLFIKHDAYLKFCSGSKRVEPATFKIALHKSLSGYYRQTINYSVKLKLLIALALQTSLLSPA
jgi:hypothetical protein